MITAPGYWGEEYHGLFLWSQLDKHDSTGDPSALEHALGDAYVGLMMLCPKQLSWVDNPMQMATDEQQMYSQYVV